MIENKKEKHKAKKNIKYFLESEGFVGAKGDILGTKEGFIVSLSKVASVNLLEKLLSLIGDHV